MLLNILQCAGQLFPSTKNYSAQGVSSNVCVGAIVVSVAAFQDRSSAGTVLPDAMQGRMFPLGRETPGPGQAASMSQTGGGQRMQVGWCGRGGDGVRLSKHFPRLRRVVLYLGGVGLLSVSLESSRGFAYMF